jgi:hypothetical protein
MGNDYELLLKYSKVRFEHSSNGYMYITWLKKNVGWHWVVDYKISYNIEMARGLYKQLLDNGYEKL